MRRRLLALSALVPLLLACGGGGRPTIRIVNADSVTLDRVLIAAAGSEYALGRLLPGTAGQIVPTPSPDSLVEVRHHRGGPFIVRAPFAAAPRLVEVHLTADGVEEIRVED